MQGVVFDSNVGDVKFRGTRVFIVNCMALIIVTIMQWSYTSAMDKKTKQLDAELQKTKEAQQVLTKYIGYLCHEVRSPPSLLLACLSCLPLLGCLSLLASPDTHATHMEGTTLEHHCTELSMAVVRCATPCTLCEVQWTR
jgi:hypothetical protein